MVVLVVSGEVVILGAGFSKAIHPGMPTVVELGGAVRPVVKRADAVDRRLVTDDFEEWLTYASAEAPWLGEMERHELLAAFFEASAALADAIDECEMNARGDSPKAWLAQLIAHWHQTCSTVITFNYDTLVEAAYTEIVNIHQGATPGNFASPSQLYGVPIASLWSRVGGALAPTFIPTFRLLKLHGSRSWLYSGRDSLVGEPLYDSFEGGGWKPPGERYSEPLTAGLVPFIVPPTIGKSRFFGHDAVREQWRQAHEALWNAEDVVVIGYSLPKGDQLVQLLLRSANRDARINVVNPDGCVAARVEELMPDCEIVQFDSVEAFVAARGYAATSVDVDIFRKNPGQ
jgi:hypothetical protein